MPNDDNDSYLIIAGTNKAGTTALFRYLSEHPEVACSRYKESRFFYRESLESPAEALVRYQQQFLGRGRNVRVCVEASPTYLHGGREVARRIRRVLPGSKLLFSLRNPTSRVISFYRSAVGQPHKVTYGVAFEEFVERAIAAAGVDDDVLESLPLQERAFRHELTMSRYAGFLRGFQEEFGVDQIRVQFFDSLRADVRKLMEDICAFVDIDPAFYADYEFGVENLTRLHRHAGLRRIAGRLNSGLEPFLNRFPVIRRLGRRVYDAVNVDRNAEIPIPEAAVAALDEFFAPANDELAALMASCYPEQPLPAWLQR